MKFTGGAPHLGLVKTSAGAALAVPPAKTAAVRARMLCPARLERGCDSLAVDQSSRLLVGAQVITSTTSERSMPPSHALSLPATHHVPPAKYTCTITV